MPHHDGHTPTESDIVAALDMPPIDVPGGTQTAQHLPDETPVKTRERISYALGDVGGNLIFAPISAFILFYFTDTVGIGAAVAGTLILFGRILDGTMDLFVGTLIDKTSTRWGKARPWLLFSTPVVVLAFVALFNVPAGLDQTGRQIYAFVFYFICLAIGYTASNLAYHTLLSVITSDSKTRVSLTVLRTFAALLTTLLVNFFTIPIMTAFGGGQAGWSTTVLIYAVVAAITFLIVFFGTKERVTTVVAADRSSAQPVLQLVKILFKNPYFLLGFGLFFTTHLLTGLGGVGIYFANDVLGNPELFGILSLAQIGPLLIGMWFVPSITARWGKRKPFLIGLIISMAGIGVTLIDPTNITFVIAGGMVKAMGTVPATAALFALVADIVDYGEWKSGVRVDGMTYSAASTGQNLGAGIGAALVGWLLAASGYNGELTTQAQTALDAQVFLYLGVPLIVYALQFVIMLFLNVDKYLPQMQTDLRLRRTGSIPTIRQ